MIHQSQASLSKHDLATARQELDRAAQADPNCAEVFLLLGLAEFQQGATADSIKHYKRALELKPHSYSGHYNLALAYVREHKLQDARIHLEAAAALDRSQPDAAYNLGMVLLELHQPAEALAPLRRARTLNPERADVAFNLVRAELEAGKTTDAQNEARDSAQRFGSDFQWAVAIGQLFLQKSQPADAVTYFVRASRLRPDDLDTRRQLALAYLDSARPQDVLSTIPEASTAEDHFLRASAYYALRNFSDADRESALALDMTPDNPQILVLRTRLLQRAGEQDNALVFAQRAISLAPGWDEPYYLAGISDYFIRRYEEAEKNLGRAAELNPKSARALFLRAIALANLGKIADAEQSLRRAIALDPQNARLHCHLGILLSRKNERAEAEAAFRKSIALKSDYGLSHFELGKLLVGSNQFKPAADEFEQAIKHDPGLTAAYYQLGRVYARLGETEKSQTTLAEFERLHKLEEQDSSSADKEQNEDARQATQAP